jgi:hypothetical protein
VRPRQTEATLHKLGVHEMSGKDAFALFFTFLRDPNNGGGGTRRAEGEEEEEQQGGAGDNTEGGDSSSVVKKGGPRGRKPSPSLARSLASKKSRPAAAADGKSSLQKQFFAHLQHERPENSHLLMQCVKRMQASRDVFSARAAPVSVGVVAVVAPAVAAVMVVVAVLLLLLLLLSTSE